MLNAKQQKTNALEISCDIRRQGQCGGALLGVMVGVVIVAIIFCAMWFFTEPAGEDGWGRLADLPAETWGCGVMSDPSPVVKMAEGVVGSLPHEIKEEIQEGITRELGLDVFSREALERAGFDTTAPVVLNVPRQGLSDEPQAMVLSIGVNDEKRVLDSIEDMARRNDLEWGRDEVSGQEMYSIDGEMILLVREGRLYMGVGESSMAVTDALRDMLDGARKKLDDSEEFDRVRRSMSNANLAGYIPLYPIFRTIRDEMYYDDEKVVVDWLMDNFEALAIAADEGRSETMVSFTSRSTLDEQLKTAEACRDFLSRLDEPMAAMTVSLDKPVQLVLDIAEELGGRAAVSEMEREFEDEFEMTRADVEKIFEQLVGGIALYGIGRYGEPELLVFFMVSKTGEQTIKDFIHKVDPKIDSQTCKNGVLYRDRHDDDFLMGLIDGYFVVGNAMKELQDLADGRGDGWEPRCGGDALVSVEYRLDKFMDGFRNVLPSEAVGIMRSFLGNNRSQQWMYAELSVDEDGLLLKAESPIMGTLMSGNVTGVAAAVAVPSFLKARQTAQRNACINNLRQIDGAKEQWALETNADSNSTPSAEDLDDYLRDGFHGLVCPAGGTYTINPLGEDPECSLKSEGHTLR